MAYSLALNAVRDPTHTVTLRQAYARACKRRFVALKKVIDETVIINDALHLDVPKLRLIGQAAGRYDFPSDPAGKAQAFMDWLMEEADKGVLEILQREGRRVTVRSEWQNTFINASYTRGVNQADTMVTRAGGQAMPSLDVWALLRQPIHADSLALLFTRNFDELKGITEAMGQQIARELALGIAKGLNPIQVAKIIRERVDAVGVYRSQLLARTEIIRAHAESTLNRYEEYGMRDVVGYAELSTAGDHRVCSLCAGLHGKRMTIAEARGVIPLHPSCRCSWIPVVMGLDGLETNTRRLFYVRASMNRKK